jgi:hypothetical protein
MERQELMIQLKWLERTHEGNEQGREGGSQAGKEKSTNEGSQQLEQLDDAKEFRGKSKAETWTEN